MAVFFEFETDFVNSLRCIPMQVRYKLDTCGIKLKLSDWLQMTQDEREVLVELPCTTQTEIEIYREYLQQLIFYKIAHKHQNFFSSHFLLSSVFSHELRINSPLNLDYCPLTINS